jgi:peptide/nickel transport system substrate-binding protein
LLNALLALIRVAQAQVSTYLARPKGHHHFGQRLISQRLTALLLLCSFCGLLLLSCGTGGSSPTNTSNRIVIGTTSKVSTLDPADTKKIFAGTIFTNLGERLYSYTPGTTQLVPQLATALPTISADGLTYTMPLRQGVIFHDGTPFDAKAMAFSLKRLLENDGAAADLLAGRVADIQATGPYELQIRLKKPFAAFTNVLAASSLCAVSPKAYEIGKDKFVPKQFVGTGPYRLVRVRTDSLRLEPFTQYWGTKPSNQGIDIQVFSSGANLYNAFRSGAVDIAAQSLKPNQIVALSQMAPSQGWQVISGDSNFVNLLTLNLRQPPWDKKEARQALAALINRNVVQNRVFQGQVEPLFSLIPSVFQESQPLFQRQYGDGQPDRGKALLAKAGYNASKPLDVDLWYRSDIASDILAALTLKAVMERDWGDTVKVTLSTVESNAGYDKLPEGIYPTFIFDWAADFLDPDNYIEPFLACDAHAAGQGCTEGNSKLSGSFFHSERINQLIDLERKETNPQQRQALFAEVQQIVADDVPFIPLWQNKSYLFARANVQGAKLEPSQHFLFSSLRKS